MVAPAFCWGVLNLLVVGARPQVDFHHWNFCNIKVRDTNNRLAPYDVDKVVQEAED